MNLPEIPNIDTKSPNISLNVSNLTQSGFERIIESGLIEDLIEAIHIFGESILTFILVLPHRNTQKIDHKKRSHSITPEEFKKISLTIDCTKKALASEYPGEEKAAYLAFLALIRFQHHIDWWNESECTLSESERNNIRRNFLDLEPLLPASIENTRESA